MGLKRWIALSVKIHFIAQSLKISKQTQHSQNTHYKLNYFIGKNAILPEYIPCITSSFPNVSIRLITFCS